MKTQYNSFGSYLKAAYFWHILLAVALFLGTLLVSVQSKAFHELAQWLDPLFGLMTLVFAMFLWWTAVKKEYSQLEQDSKTMLAKRLTLRFVYGGKVVLECKEAMLTDAADIRAWSQQVGSQMVGGRNLDFFPFVRIEEPVFRTDTAGSGKSYWLYTAVFTLKNFPKKANEPTQEQNEVDQKLASGQCLYWTPVYHSNGTFQLVPLWSEALPIM
jgi:hypothetical protein